MNRSIQSKALNSEVRLRALRLLAEPQRHFAQQWSADPVHEGVCMTLIAQALGIAQPTVSRHLQILNDAGFIDICKAHKWSYCKRNDAVIAEYLRWLQQELLLPEIE